MKTKFYTLLSGMLLGVMFSSQAAVLRVNNDPNITAPYSTFNAAQTAASPGDTIYFEGTAISYGQIMINKKLVLMGPGYFLNQNPQTQSNINSATTTGIYINSTAANGSKILGMVSSDYIYFNLSGNHVQDIEIARCYCSQIGGQYSSISNILIRQNYVASTLTLSGIHNSLITNNYVYQINVNSPTNSVAIYNNVISSSPNLTNIQFFNNILTAGGTATLTNSNTYNNLCSATQLPAGNNNQQNVSMSNVFVCWSSCTGYSTDGRYQLKAGSPAIGAGANGEDCGMFGGSEPYVLSGMPAIPAIYSFQYNNNNAVINVTMSAKSHN